MNFMNLLMEFISWNNKVSDYFADSDYFTVAVICAFVWKLIQLGFILIIVPLFFPCLFTSAIVEDIITFINKWNNG